MNTLNTIETTKTENKIQSLQEDIKLYCIKCFKPIDEIEDCDLCFGDTITNEVVKELLSKK